MKRISGVFLLLSLLIVLTSCATDTETIEYRGKSKHWNVTYNVIVSSDNSTTTNVLLKYIGGKPVPITTDQKNPTEIQTKIFLQDGEYESSKSGLNPDKKSQTGNISCTVGCSVPDKKDKIDAIVNWDGKSESMVLVSK
ncbi:hypothetical protein [Peribacillus deserti]|uniref:Lipoprotein n=1 Tax=Peribacillus deserti TaxID=673318 RepID=A0A2N5M4L3_9BACI|nr:hypothetical protein [Peribacillus deserti]PLT29275.1 hypothetical protein CUU66_13995 [Peribacillus deserti]